MILENLTIRRNHFSEQYTGQIKFKGDDKTEIQLELDDEFCRAIIPLCADAIARAGRDAARALTAEALSQQVLEHQPPPEQSDE